MTARKQVVVVASGDTELQALPHLLRHLSESAFDVDIRKPRNHLKINAEVTEKIILSAWYERRTSSPPDKFVILLDADGKEPDAVVKNLETVVRPRLEQRIPVPLLFVAAKWHLEAWFFADPASLRGYLKKNLGAVDPSSPDTIQNPKLHLKGLLPGGMYTARTAGEIAKRINPDVVRARSPSFATFERAIQNGPKKS